MTRIRWSPSVDNDVRALFGVVAFRNYAVSRVTSAIAMSLLQAVILWQVYAISGSTLSLGLVGLIGFMSALLSSVIGGAVVDAYDRRVVLLASQLVPGLASIAVLAAKPRTPGIPIS